MTAQHPDDSMSRLVAQDDQIEHTGKRGVGNDAVTSRNQRRKNW